MRIIEWIRDMFGEKDTITLAEKIETQQYKLAVEDFAIQMAINLIAGAVSKCEFKTLAKGTPVKKGDHYVWNIEPNVNQNSSQFIGEIVRKLLYYNECLVIEQNGQLIVADDFVHTEYALFPDTFTSVRRGELTFQKTFYAEDVMYFRYSEISIRALLSSLMKGYSGLLSMAVNKYKRAGGRNGIVTTETTPQQNDSWQKALNDLYGNRFKSYFKEENALVVLPRGIKYDEISGEGSKKSTSEVNDIANITKEAFMRVAQAFKIPPALLQGEIADVESLVDEFLTFCVDPLCDLIQTEINRKYYGKEAYINGYKLMIDTTCVKHIDVFSTADKADKLISAGLYNIDDLREKLGDVPLNTWWSRMHWMTKNYADIAKLPAAGGGEVNED